MKILPIVLSASALALASPALAAGDLSRADPIEIVVEMGSASDAAEKSMYFKPNRLDLETGKAYKIVLRNTDKVEHELVFGEFGERVFTRKIEIADASGGLVAEIKGNVTEIEVGPGKEVEWYIVPVQTGENLPIECEIEGHKEAGMVGTVTIR